MTKSCAAPPAFEILTTIGVDEPDQPATMLAGSICSLNESVTVSFRSGLFKVPLPFAVATADAVGAVLSTVAVKFVAAVALPAASVAVML